MKLSDFIKLNNPIEYNFEFENKLLAESGLDTYSRYFTYKANNDKARNSGYENGKKFAEVVNQKFGNIADCDGTLENNENDTCMLTREVYRVLWGWNDVSNGKLSRYGISAIDSFGLVGPETMNSAQTIVNMIIKESFESCNEKNIVSLKKGRISANFMLELFANEISKKTLEVWLNEVNGLSSYLDLYHSLGNFVLVPAYFNPYRASAVDDFWDQSLCLLDSKNEKWLSNNNEVVWDKKLFVRYINYFFLWDYTESYKPVVLSKYSNHKELEIFLEKTCEKIVRRSKFMLTMLKINEINPNFYAELVDVIFNTDNQYKNYLDVIKKIKAESCYLDINIKEIIDLLERDLQ